MIYSVYYMKPQSFRRFNFGGEFPTVDNLVDTHKRVRIMVGDNHEDVFTRMQGEVWSPNGEQRERIQRLGLEHTSMSVGDVIREHTSGKFFVVAPIGFKEMD